MSSKRVHLTVTMVLEVPEAFAEENAHQIVPAFTNALPFNPEVKVIRDAVDVSPAFEVVDE